MKFTEKQIQLIKAFGREDLLETCHNFSDAGNVLIYMCFFNDLTGAHVDELREYYRSWLDGEK